MMLPHDLEGVTLTPLKRIPTAKGQVLHAMKQSDAGYCGFGEAYFSEILEGQVKGWKRHLQMTLNLVVPHGRVRFVIYDDRSQSPTQGQFNDTILCSEHYYRLTVSPGLWVAFQGLAAPNSLVLNIANMEHDPEEAENVDVDRFTFDWSLR